MLTDDYVSLISPGSRWRVSSLKCAHNRHTFCVSTVKSFMRRKTIFMPLGLWFSQKQKRSRRPSLRKRRRLSRQRRKEEVRRLPECKADTQDSCRSYCKSGDKTCLVKYVVKSEQLLPLLHNCVSYVKHCTNSYLSTSLLLSYWLTLLVRPIRAARVPR